MEWTAAATYIVTVTTKTVTAAATDHQIRAAMTGRPTSSQAPTARVSIPLALRSANQSASRIRWKIVPHLSSYATRAPIRKPAHTTATLALRATRHVLRLSCSVRTPRATSHRYAQAMTENLRIERGWIFVNGTRQDDGTIELGTGGEMRFSPFEAMSQRQDTQITWGDILTASVQRLAFWRR